MVSATKINKNTPFVGLINYKISRISKNDKNRLPASEPPEYQALKNAKPQVFILGSAPYFTTQQPGHSPV